MKETIIKAVRFCIIMYAILGVLALLLGMQISYQAVSCPSSQEAAYVISGTIVIGIGYFGLGSTIKGIRMLKDLSRKEEP